MITEQSRGLIVALSIRWFGCRNGDGPDFRCFVDTSRLDNTGGVERVASKMDFSRPRVIADYALGEGVHSCEIARRMSPDSHLVLFGLDSACAHHLERQFAQDRRVNVIHGDAARAAIC